MSTGSNQSIYQFHLQTSNGPGGDEVYWNASSQSGMSDEWANAIYQALKGVTPPAGCQMEIAVTRQDASSTIYTTDTSSNPITFT